MNRLNNSMEASRRKSGLPYFRINGFERITSVYVLAYSCHTIVTLLINLEWRQQERLS